MKNFILFIMFVIALAGLYSYFSNAKNNNDNLITNVNDQNSSSLSFLSDNQNELPKESVENTSIPILMYHHVKNCDDSCDKIEKGLSIPPTDFDSQMKYLKDHDYQTIALDNLFYRYDKKTVVLTFDDGYKDNILEALPILKKYGFIANIFIISDFVGNDRYLNWDDIKILEHSGWKIGAHTKNHPDLINLSYEDQKDQIQKSKITIEENLHNKIKFFSYPAGKYDDKTIEIVRNSGFLGAVTTDSGTENTKDDIFKLKRLRINGSDSLDAFINKVSY